MKINILQNSRIIKVSLLVATVAFVISCNKELPVATPIIYPPVNNSPTSIGAAISADTSYSFFKAAATKTGVLAALSDSTKLFTVFLPNNDAFRVSGIPSIAALNTIPLQSLVPLIQYHIIPGEQYLSANVPSTFPNIQLPTYLKIGTIPGTPLSLEMSAFPSIRTNGFWYNNIPVVAPDIKFSNGVVHLVAALVAPPSQVLKDAMYSNPNLTYFKAAIARADSGQVGLKRFDSLLNYPVTNMTVLAPSDLAFQTLLFGSIYGALLAQGVPQATAYDSAVSWSSTSEVFSNPALFGVLTAAKVQGILAYHLLATPNPLTGKFEPNIRAFSVNFPSTPAFYTTIVNTVVAVHPGIMAKATFTGPFVTNLQFTGLGTFPPGGAPYSGAAATATSLDKHCVNGVYYIIDKA